MDLKVKSKNGQGSCSIMTLWIRCGSCVNPMDDFWDGERLLIIIHNLEFQREKKKRGVFDKLLFSYLTSDCSDYVCDLNASSLLTKYCLLDSNAKSKGSVSLWPFHQEFDIKFPRSSRFQSSSIIFMILMVSKLVLEAAFTAWLCCNLFYISYQAIEKCAE